MYCVNFTKFCIPATCIESRKIYCEQYSVFLWGMCISTYVYSYGG